jgi:hypothetical protein
MSKIFRFSGFLILATLFVAGQAAAGVIDDTQTHLLITNLAISTNSGFGGVEFDLTNWYGKAWTDGGSLRFQDETHKVAPEPGEMVPQRGPMFMYPIALLSDTLTDTKVQNHNLTDYSLGPYDDTWRLILTRTGADTVNFSVEAYHGAVGTWYAQGAEVPEPATFALLGAALGALAILRRRRA